MVGRMESASCIDFGGNEIREGCPCVVVSDGDGCIPLENTTLMQFTGLHDKNAHNDIYEGDIIDIEGNVIGNVYETEETYTGRTNCIVATMAADSWGSFVKEAIERGCQYA